jgi:hypothetical protein
MVALLALGLGFLGSTTLGQAQKGAPAPTPPPALTAVTPNGIQRGTALELTLTGTNLAGPLGAWASFPAKITIPNDANNGKDAAKLRVKLEVPKDAPLGYHSLRVATAGDRG